MIELRENGPSGMDKPYEDMPTWQGFERKVRK